MYYYLYQITNILNGKIYVGIHRTPKLDDGYMGSGIHIKDAMRQYGKENFVKEILRFGSSYEDILTWEAELVTEAFVKREDTYNAVVGGVNNFNYVNERGLNLYGKNGENGKRNLLPADKLKELLVKRGTWEKRSRKISDIQKQKISRGERPASRFLGKKHSAEAKKAIGEKNKLKQQGTNNSQYGSMWIFNPDTKENKKIRKSDPIPTGWQQGRKLKF